jgi:DNA-binding transcriptional MerR regulator
LQRYAALTREGEHTAAARRAILEEHRSKVRAQIEELHTALQTVEHKIERLASGVAHKS